jgi:DNA-binding MarR family transcriptional regulator
MPPEPEGMNPDEYFLLWVLIAQTKDSILKARERDYARYGISNERRAVLWDIQNNGGSATPVEIARNLFRELHSVTELLKRMEKDGLISRQSSPGRSRVEARLTEKGLDVFNQSLQNDTDRRIFSALTQEERDCFMSCLWKVRSKALQDLGIPEWRLKFPLNPNGVEGPERED